jgi:hypothetical protein
MWQVYWLSWAWVLLHVSFWNAGMRELFDVIFNKWKICLCLVAHTQSISQPSYRYIPSEVVCSKDSFKQRYFTQKAH